MKIEFLKKIISLIDLTRLNESDTEADIAALCKTAITPLGHVAAICIYPQFIRQAKEFFFDKPVKIATVINFPHGSDPLADVLSSIQLSIQEGADEIDVVFPYSRYLKGETQAAYDFIQQCKATCGEKIILKVILETGELNQTEIIARASRDALLAGADFLKTSTGKVAVGATPMAAKIMLETIRDMSLELNRSFGFKVSGGVRTIEQANQYIDLASDIMGASWVTAQTFRIGASQLYDVLLASA